MSASPLSTDVVLVGDIKAKILSLEKRSGVENPDLMDEILMLKMRVFELIDKYETKSGNSSNPVNADESAIGDVESDAPFEEITRIELKYNDAHFDQNGLFYYIGTRGKSTAYTNPHTVLDSGVVVSCSSVVDEDVSDLQRFIDHSIQGPNGTADDPNSWMQVDIGASRRMVVRHYCIRHGYDEGLYILRHWELQASHTGGTNSSEWLTLITHEYDESLVEGGYSTADWTVDLQEEQEGSAQVQKGYRYFRIRQNDFNSHNNHHLCCSGIELYGILLTNGAAY